MKIAAGKNTFSLLQGLFQSNRDLSKQQHQDQLVPETPHIQLPGSVNTIHIYTIHIVLYITESFCMVSLMLILASGNTIAIKMILY